MLHRLRELGLSARVFERGSDVGGTWYWNRYPGARCDVESIDYSYSFSRGAASRSGSGPSATRRSPRSCATSSHVADRFDLRRDIAFDTARDGGALRRGRRAAGRSRPTTGERVTAPVLRHGDRLPVVGASGPTSRGSTTSAGEWYHTGRVAARAASTSPGKRVGVVGTGSTGIQAIPQIAQQADAPVRLPADAELQRCRRATGRSTRTSSARGEAPTYAERRARSREQSASGRAGRCRRRGRRSRSPPRSAAASTRPAGRRAASARSRRRSTTCSRAPRRTTRRRVRPRQDPRDRATTRPWPSCSARRTTRSARKRHVRRHRLLRDVQPRQRRRSSTSAARRSTRSRRAAIAHRRAPSTSSTSIVFATGFDAMTGALLDIDIRGRGGRSLRDKWADGPRTYLGLAVAGLPEPVHRSPGPGSPVGAEQHGRCRSSSTSTGSPTASRTCASDGLDAIEADAPRPRRSGSQHVERGRRRRRSTRGPNSWYIGANIPGKPRVFMPYVGGVRPLPAALRRGRGEGLRGVHALGGAGRGGLVSSLQTTREWSDEQAG